jgi:O-antigen/teichoic acid export membrane protein
MNPFVHTTKEKLKQILKKSEKYIKTDMLYLTSGGFWLGLSEARGVIVSMVTTILLAYFLPKESYGTYQYLISLGSIFGAFALTGLITSVRNDSALNINRSLKSSFRLYLLSSVPASIVQICLGLYYLTNQNVGFFLALVIFSFFIPLTNASSLFFPFLNGKEKFKEASNLGNLTIFLPSLIFIISLFFFRSPTAIVVAFVIPKALCNYLAYLIVKKKYAEQSSYAESEQKEEGIRFAWHVSLINFISLIANRADGVILFQLLGPVGLASYLIAVSVPDRIQNIAKNLSAVLIPKITRLSAEEAEKSFNKKLPLILTVNILIIVCMIIVIPFAYTLIFPKYAESIRLAQIYCLSLVSLSSFFPLSTMVAKEKTSALYSSTLISSIFQILILACGAYYYGILGAVIAKIISKAASSLVYWKTT